MSTLLSKSENYVFELFKERLARTYLYHNFLHTQRVVESTQEIIEHTVLTDDEKCILMVAAWFHDTGYVQGAQGHEKVSADIAAEFLKKEGKDENFIQEVAKCIRATKFDSEPTSKLEEIIRDADSSHFAKEYYSKVSELLRQELKLQDITTFSPKEWRLENIKMFTECHQYYTRYAIENWEPKKNEHLVSLLKKKKKNKKKDDKEELKAKLKAKYKEESPERGIQTLFRVTLRNHIKLSDIADTKANILLSVNAIIISLALANLIPKLDSPTNRHLMIPSLVLVLFSVASVILSIMSTQPKVTSGEFTKEQVKNKEVNLLFFGNFHKMPFEQYQWAINEILLDKSYVYEMLTKDLYLLGIVLNKKYKLLKITYVVFTIGIILSVLAFIIAFSNTEFRPIEEIIISK
ncbi:DUF5706 domain-containing protein [Aquimarina sp. ERC-38]|uniref:Pycsar system effector family protein n=1 Tax=Aquimarina sp. ERC-38 TaxID=2949996 RepID=UPI002246C094|nr:Pycsar system effector family protein [Aquimarina sp. ERC-38]UZO81090.1 DUF5706 domain-containing protein [Aquimarina sp. ERC-38]